MNKLTRNQIMCGTFLMAVALIMYLLNVFTPLFCDDWHYVFIFGTTEPITSLGGIIKSQCAHYLGFNGRFLVHSVVQLFDGILGKGMFNVFNAVMFVVFLYSMALVTSDEKKYYFKIMSLAFLLLFLVLRGFKYSFLWLSGSVNYLWVATALLIFHHYLQRERVPDKALFPLTMFGFICGWSNEAFIIGLGAAYFFYYLFHRDQLSRHRRYMLAAFYLGALLVVLSPGSINRALHGSSTFHYGLMFNLIHMKNVGIVYVLLLMMVYKLISSPKQFVAWARHEQVWLIATVVAFLFVLPTGAVTEHSRFGIEFFAMVLILRSVNWERIVNWPFAVADVAVVAFAAYITVCCHKYYLTDIEELAQLDNGSTLVMTSQPDIPSFVHDYILDYSEVYTGYDMKPYGYAREWIPDYYGVEDVLFLPRAFVEDVRRKPSTYNEFKTFGNLPFYAKRVPTSRQVHAAALQYKDPSYFSYLPKSLYPLGRIVTGEPEAIIGSNPSSIELDGQRYILIHRTWPDQDKRLKSIRLE